MTEVPVTPTKTIRKYGWRPDRPSIHDQVLAPAPYSLLSALPPLVNLESHMPPVYDQGNLNSCTSHAIAAAIEYNRKKLSLPDFIPSRLFIYYNERNLEGEVGMDNGAAIRDGIKTVLAQGACHESLWPYNESKVFTLPSANAYTDAKKYLVTGAARVTQTIDQMRSVLAGGQPIILGFTVYDSFESDEVARTGIVKLPKITEQSQGGHAVLVVGYDHNKQTWRVRNSWGPAWGQKGYFEVPYLYFASSHLAADLWMIEGINHSS